MLNLVKISLFCIGVLLPLTHGQLLKAATHQYRIEIDEKISLAKVNICFDGSAPRFLTVDSKYANRDLVKLPHSQQGEVEIQGRFWKTQYLEENACIDYQVNLERHHAKRTKFSKNRRNIAYINSNTWLWLPEYQSRDDEIKLHFEIPEWAAISAPWLQTHNQRYEFILGHQPQEWSYTLLIGDFSQALYQVSPGYHLSIATLRNLENKPLLINWLLDTARSLQNYLGEYPVKQTQVILFAKDKKKHGPVPWGEFSRGNGYGISFIIVPSFDIQEFYADWTATHEFSHQLLPKLYYDDIWLSEGLASYLQYVLMAQSGHLDKERAWYRLYKGLKRGEKGTQNVANEALKYTADRRSRGGRTGRTMRIYWSGAAYFMKADLELRKQSDGKVGLNDILLKLNRCCIPAEKIWSGEALAKKLDELSQTKIFYQSYKTLANSEQFPNYKPVLERLGVRLPNKQSSKKGQLQVEPNSYADVIMQSTERSKNP